MLLLTLSQPSAALWLHTMNTCRLLQPCVRCRSTLHPCILYTCQAHLAVLDSGCAQIFTPLVEKCKSLGRAMRIGTNHGSLSARILSYYGDTPR